MSKTIYTKEHKNIVDRLILARRASGLKQEEVAKKLKRSQSYVSKIESGQRRIDLVQLRAFAGLYKKDIKYFV